MTFTVEELYIIITSMEEKIDMWRMYSKDESAMFELIRHKAEVAIAEIAEAEIAAERAVIAAE